MQETGENDVTLYLYVKRDYFIFRWSSFIWIACDMPSYKKKMLSYVWNVIDAINETHSFSFPTDYKSLLNVEDGLGRKSERILWKDA